VGPSGCGKATLLRCIAGLIPPTSGRVVLRGVPVHDVPDGLAVVLQDYGRSLFPWLSVRDNVAMPLRRTIRSRAARRKAADAALAAVGLPGSGPGRVRADLRVDLPGPRDQIETKELPEFVHLRTEVSRLVRSRDEPAAANGTVTADADPRGR
jgi:ABC-type glutathione transport system ATPase component